MTQRPADGVRVTLRTRQTTGTRDAVWRLGILLWIASLVWLALASAMNSWRWEDLFGAGALAIVGSALFKWVDAQASCNSTKNVPLGAVGRDGVEGG